MRLFLTLLIYLFPLLASAGSVQEGQEMPIGDYAGVAVVRVT